MAEGIFQGKPDITSGGETKNFDHGFFSQGGEEETQKTLVLKLPCHILRIWLRRRRINGYSDWRRRNRTIDMAKEILTLKKREKLISPEKIICGGEFNSDHLDHGVEGEGRIGHGRMRRLIQRRSDTITMFVKPPHFYGVEFFHLYIRIQDRVEFEYRDKLEKIITNGNRIRNQWKPYLLQSRRMP